jgi:RHS repeat-associated protein
MLVGITTYISPTTTTGRSAYDGLRRRVRKFVTDGSVTHDNYYTASWQLAEVRKNSDTDPLDQYVWGLRYIDAVVVRFHDDNTDGVYSADLSDLTLYYVNDANMNLTLLMDEGAGLRGRFAYDAYGKPLFLRQSWTVRTTQATHRANPIHYAGYHYDEETGLYHVRHRTYNPTLGRWVQVDPLRYVDGMNVYEYVASMPLVSLDMSGLSIYVGLHKTADGTKTARDAIIKDLKPMCPCVLITHTKCGKTYKLGYTKLKDKEKSTEKGCFCCIKKHLAGCSILIQVMDSNHKVEIFRGAFKKGKGGRYSYEGMDGGKINYDPKVIAARKKPYAVTNTTTLAHELSHAHMDTRPAVGEGRRMQRYKELTEEESKLASCKGLVSTPAKEARKKLKENRKSNRETRKKYENHAIQLTNQVRRELKAGQKNVPVRTEYNKKINLKGYDPTAYPTSQMMTDPQVTNVCKKIAGGK